MRNLEALAKNPYPGRGLIVGLSNGGRYLVQVYWIMGRSENSRNRVFVVEGGSLRTALADDSKTADRSLIIYRAMAERSGLFVVSNGDQTDDVIAGDVGGMFFEQSLRNRVNEPDAPNFTPRITAIFSTRSVDPVAEILILKRSQIGNGCDRFLYRYDDLRPGVGYCVTTYSGDGNPLPSFCGEPYLLPTRGSIDEVAKMMWNSLNEENRVSLAVKFIKAPDGESSEIRVINKYQAVA
ncbi:MAG TPA: IMP cyclohydrolase [Candidatus Nanoarchaeia archaeon]|nr:IMP cyclohydrolase [Candidatus Nanoarchaeia archaeon]